MRRVFCVVVKKKTKKISDLGPLLRTPATGNTTRLRYTAPEVLAGEDTSLKSDVYSFGMLVLECLTRRLPWQADENTVATATKDGTTTVEDALLSRAVMSGDRPGVPGDAPRDLARVARACWAHDPASRPDMVRVLEGLYPTGLTATSTVAAAGESGEAVPTGATTTTVDDEDNDHPPRNGKTRAPHDDDDDDEGGPKAGPRGAGAVRGGRGVGGGTTPRSFELSSPRKMFPFPSGVGPPLVTMTPGTPSSSSRRRTTSLETFSTLGVSSTTSSARSSVSRHVRGASAGGGWVGVGGIAGGGVFTERSHTMPARTQRSRSRKDDGADAPCRAESLPCLP